MKLRVWWIPQVPMTSFRVNVENLREAKLLLDTLAQYDLFQLKHNVKPDYCNAGGLEVWDVDSQEWLEWEDVEGYNIDDLTMDQVIKLEPQPNV